MTEIRTKSATGGEKGVKPQRHSLLPKHGLDVIAEVFGFGAAKYADHNWRRKYEWSKSYDALQRHLTAWWDGEDIDPESGLSHLGHAGFHILVLATWERLDGQGSEFDDRHTFNRPQESAAEEEARLLEWEAALDESQKFEPFEKTDISEHLKVMQDAINQTVEFALQGVIPVRVFTGAPRFAVDSAGEVEDADPPVERGSYATRWLKDYDDDYLRDNAIVNAFSAGPDLLPKRRPVDQHTFDRGGMTNPVREVINDVGRPVRVVSAPTLDPGSAWLQAEEADFEWPHSMRAHLQRALDRRP